MKNNNYKQLCIEYQEALKPLWSIYTCDHDDYRDTIDGPVRIFMDSYDLCEDLRYVEEDEQVSAENKTNISKFIELRSQLDKLGDGPHFSLIDILNKSDSEREAAWDSFYAEAIPLLEKLLAATPSFVSAMYAYRNMPTPASL